MRDKFFSNTRILPGQSGQDRAAGPDEDTSDLAARWQRTERMKFVDALTPLDILCTESDREDLDDNPMLRQWYEDEALAA